MAVWLAGCSERASAPVAPPVSELPVVDQATIAPGRLVILAHGLSLPKGLEGKIRTTGGEVEAIPGGWTWSVGTSFAAPHAAGLAALINLVR
ncbi:MAG: hypothetical protein ACE5HP_06075 [Gemmatimonadota bacterium]